MYWCCLNTFYGGLRSILIMWDRRMVKKIEDCVGEFSIVNLFKNVEHQFS
jgi:hypothetical protein